MGLEDHAQAIRASQDHASQQSTKAAAEAAAAADAWYRGLMELLVDFFALAERQGVPTSKVKVDGKRLRSYGAIPFAATDGSYDLTTFLSLHLLKDRELFVPGDRRPSRDITASIAGTLNRGWCRVPLEAIEQSLARIVAAWPA